VCTHAVFSCSRSLSVYMRQFVCSVIIGKDLVPRLGIITLDIFKKQMLSELHSCRLPKVASLLHVFYLLAFIIAFECVILVGFLSSS